jgi:CRISPR-associated protein Cas1
MPVRRLHYFLYCPRLFYLQWVEDQFVENADTAAGSSTHKRVDEPSRLRPQDLKLDERL